MGEGGRIWHVAVLIDVEQVSLQTELSNEHTHGGRGLTCPRAERRRVGAGSVKEPLIFKRLTLEARGEGVFSGTKVRRAGV
jgi:hypothetical protein